MLNRQATFQANQVLRRISSQVSTSTSFQSFQQTRTYAAKVASFSRKSEKSKRETTPSKKAGSIYSFQYNAAYSKYHQKAQGLSEGVGSQILDTADIFGTEPFDATKSTVYKYSEPAAKALTCLGSFKPFQRNELFRNKATLIRESSSAEIFNIIKKNSEQSSQSNRYCITGAKGVGKTTALAQAHAFAVEQGQVVIHISQALTLVDGSGPAILAKSSGKSESSTPVFNQPLHVKKLLKKIAGANANVLSNINTSKAYVYKIAGTSEQFKIAKGASLLKMITDGRKNGPICEVFNDFFAELSQQTTTPVLFTIDDFNVFSHHQYSLNRDTDNNPIYHGNLLIPKTFLDYFSGEKSFAKGTIIASLSSYKDGYTIPHGLNEAEPYAYAKPNDYDPVLANKMRNNGGVKKLEIKPFTFNETATVLNYYDNAKILHEPLTESFVQEKYFLSGNGNPLSLIQSCSGNF